MLVNVAGIMDSFSSVDGVSDEEWDKVMATNLTVPVRMMRAVLPFMREKKSGVIVNVASTAGLSGAVAGIAYTCSKHGLVSYHCASFMHLGKRALRLTCPARRLELLRTWLGAFAKKA